jgi:hypothetical protein
MHVQFKNPRTGEIKEVKIGWSWTLFLFSGIFGLPLFLRKLNVWGELFLALAVVNIIGPPLVDMSHPFVGIGLRVNLFFVFLGLEIWLGIKGNEMTAKNYLENGWLFADEGTDSVRFARDKWGLAT